MSCRSVCADVVRSVVLFPFLIAVTVLGLPRLACAQSADDVAARVGTVARAMGAVEKDPWSVNAALTGSASRGNTDTTNLRGTVIYVRDSGVWRFGSYLSGALDTKNGQRANERAGLNLALARRYGDAFRLVGIEEIVRAPLDGLRSRNLLGGMGVWTPPRQGIFEASFYLGAGWANEKYTTGEPNGNYGAGLTGASLAVAIAEKSTLNLVASYTRDLDVGRNYKIGSSISLKASINSVLGMQLNYAIAYDNAPVRGKVTTNNAFGAGLTLGWKGR
ncbi:MAG: DUF481 domain-containing protein [Vicinamibacterales bacterium]